MPRVCCIMPGQARPLYTWPSGCLDPSLVLCLCFIHSFGSSFPQYACRPTTTELWAISRTTHNQKITGGPRGGPLSTGVLSHKSSMRKNIANGVLLKPTNSHHQDDITFSWAWGSQSIIRHFDKVPHLTVRCWWSCLPIQSLLPWGWFRPAQG